MSKLLDRVAKRVGASPGLHLRRTRAGHWQRAAGAWSWYAVDDDGREVLASHYSLAELLSKPGLTATPQDRNPLGAVEIDPAMCQMCERHEATWDYDPYVAELHEDQDPAALLCDECFEDRKGDI